MPDPTTPESRFCLANGALIRFVQRDCVAALCDPELVAPGSVDVIVTSPPYNLGIDYGRYDDRLPRDAYLDWMGEWGAACRQALSPTGSLFLNIAGKPTDPWGPFDVLQRLRPHFQLQNVIHWVKSIAIAKEDVGNYPGLAGDLAVGHYKPINSSRFLNDCQEYIFHLTVSGDVPLDRLAVGVPYRDKSNVTRWKGAARDVHCRGNTWFIPYPTIQRRSRDRPHPASFPPRLPEMCLRLHGLERVRLAVDPFLGIGSTAVACAGLGVNFLGFEIDGEYLEHARERLGETLGLFGSAEAAE